MALLRERGVLRMSDFLAEGIHHSAVKHLVDAGEVENPVRGVYKAAADWNPNLGTVVEAVRSRAVVCLLSAAAHHLLTTSLPGEVWLAVPRNGWVPRRSAGAPPIKFIRMDALETDEFVTDEMIGIQEDNFGSGHVARVTTPERTVADLFRYAGVPLSMPDGTKRSPIHLDLAIEALQTALGNGADKDAILDMARLVGAERMVSAALLGGQSMRR